MSYSAQYQKLHITASPKYVPEPVWLFVPCDPSMIEPRMKTAGTCGFKARGSFFSTHPDTHLKDGRAQVRATDDLPLSGLTVIESCRRIQGPLAGHLLALLGAEVIRIEPPGGDPLRGMPPIADDCSARFDALNRFKTIREVDIKSLAGQAEVKEMVQHADVFLHNWAPGKAVLLNLDHEDLAATNPSLIYAYAGWLGNRQRGTFSLEPNARHRLHGPGLLRRSPKRSRKPPALMAGPYLRYSMCSEALLRHKGSLSHCSIDV